MMPSSLLVTIPSLPSRWAEQPKALVSPCFRVGKVIPRLEGRSNGAARRHSTETDTPARVLDRWRAAAGLAQLTPSATKHSADADSCHIAGRLGSWKCLAGAGFGTGNPYARAGTSNSASERAE